MDETLFDVVQLPTPTKNGHQASGEMTESPSGRVVRIYLAEGGPLIGWLLDEARVRGDTLAEMAKALSVTYGYINQLRNGIRRVAAISDDMVRACSRYIGVPPVVVKILAGQVNIRDFVYPHQSEELVIDRALERMLADPLARTLLPGNVTALSFDAKKALVMLYADSVSTDVLGVQALPNMLRWLQRAALIHDESEGEVHRGRRDVG